VARCNFTNQRRAEVTELERKKWALADALETCDIKDFWKIATELQAVLAELAIKGEQK